MRGQDVYVVDAVRTPMGRLGGALAQIRPDDLAAAVVGALVNRQEGLDPQQLDGVTFGAANQAGEDNRNVGRMAVLLNGLPTSIPGNTVNRLCASGLDAVIGAAREIAVGDADLLIAGGSESMSRAPYVVEKAKRAYSPAHAQMWSTTLGWRLVNPRMPDQWTISLGESAEKLADLYEVTREQQDEYAVRSHRLATAAWEAGTFADHLVEIEGAPVTWDETVRPDTDMASLAALKPAFRPDGTVTAGNSSPLNDGAAGVLLASERMVAELGVEPLARIRASAAHGVDPDVFGIAPVEAVRTALSRSGHDFGDVTTLELNEAFASQVLSCLHLWPELDPELVNPWGGAIALGHPLGSSGARLVGAVAHQLQRAGGGVGVASLCIGVGQGLALVLER